MEEDEPPTHASPANCLLTLLESLSQDQQAQLAATGVLPEAIRTELESQSPTSLGLPDQLKAEVKLMLLRRQAERVEPAVGEESAARGLCPADLDISQRQYERLRELGRGGMGAVYEVWDRNVNRPLAMKVLLDRESSELDSVLPIGPVLARFLNEARITGQLDHPGVIPVHEIASDKDGRIFFTMPVVAGRSLQDIFGLSEKEKRQEGWSQTRLLNVLLNVCETLAYAHSKGIIHRDLKPANIMVGQFGETYVMDWGLAKRTIEPGAMESSEPSGPDPTDPPTAPSSDGRGAAEAEASRSGRDRQGLDSKQRTPSTSDTDSPSSHLPPSGVDTQGEEDTLFTSSLWEPTPTTTPTPTPSAEIPDFSNLTIPGTVMGTPNFMAPEQARGQTESLGFESDIYSVGGILYSILAGHLPYADQKFSSGRELLEHVGETPPTPLDSLVRKGPPETVAICEKAMAWNPGERYETIAAMGDDLRAYLENRVVRAHRTGAVAELKKWVRRNRGVATAIAAAIVTGLCAVGVILHLQSVRVEEQEGYIGEINQALSDEREALLQSQSLVFAGESNRILPEDPSSALLLAMEADRLKPGSAPNTALLKALKDCREIRTLTGSSQRPRPAVFSADGSRFVSASDDHGIYIGDAHTGRRMAYGLGHSNTVRHVSFAPGGTRVVSTSLDGTAAIWEAGSGRMIHRLVGHKGGVQCAAISSDGSTVATGSHDTTIRLWRMDTGAFIREFVGHSAMVLTATFSAGGDRLLTGSADGTARLWDTATGRELAQMGGLTGDVHHARYSPDGSKILTVAAERISREAREPPGEKRRCQIWSADDGTFLSSHAHQGDIEDAAFLSGGHLVVTVSSDGKAQLWRSATGELVGTLVNSGGALSAVAAHESTGLVAVAGKDYVVTVLNAESGERVAELRGHDDTIVGLRFHSDGTKLLTTADDDTVRLWRVAAGPLSAFPERCKIEKDHIDPLDPLDPFHPRLPLVLTIRQGTPSSGEAPLPGVVDVWEYPSAQLRYSLTPNAPLAGARFTPDGEYVVLLDQEGKVRRFRAGDGAPVSKFSLTAGVSTFDLSDDGQFLLVGWPDRGLAQRWRLADANVDEEIRLGPQIRFRFSDDGKRVIASSSTHHDLLEFGERRPLARLVTQTDGSAYFAPGGRKVLCWPDQHLSQPIQLWDASSGGHISQLPGHEKQVDHFAFSDDGKWFAASSGVDNDGKVRLWSTGDGELRQTFEGHAGKVHSCWVSPDGHRVVTSCNNKNDRTTRLWSGTTGRLVAILGRKESGVKRAAFSSGGQLAATVFKGDHEVSVWSTDTGELLMLLPGEESEGPIRFAFFSPDDRWIITGSERGAIRIWPVDVEGFATRHLPRSLSPEELDLYQVGTPDERRAAKSRLVLAEETESLRLLARSVDSTDPHASPLEGARRAYRGILGRILEEIPTAPPPEIGSAAAVVLASLETLGRQDPEAYRMGAGIQEATGNRTKALNLAQQALGFPGASEVDLEQLRQLIHRLKQAAGP